MLHDDELYVPGLVLASHTEALLNARTVTLWGGPHCGVTCEVERTRWHHIVQWWEYRGGGTSTRHEACYAFTGVDDVRRGRMRWQGTAIRS